MRVFLSTARMTLREKSYFGLGETLGQYLLSATGLAMQLLIWRALIAPGEMVEGMTLEKMISYAIVSSTISPLLNVRTPASSWLHDGTMLGLYQRPASLFGQLAAHTVGGWVLPLLLYGLPVMLVSALCGANLRPASTWFYLSLPLTLTQGFAVDYLFACLLIRMKNLEWTVHSLREAMNVLLTGALIPFAALPWGMGAWLELSPLGTLAGAPLALFSGLSAAPRLIGAQILWNVTLWPLAMYCFARSRERMVSFGG